jgi:uncharacterized protein YqeY
MATRIAPLRLWLTSRPFPSRPTNSKCLRCLYSTSTDAPPAPVLAKLRTDLKSAMRARDTQRLNVLRAILAEVTNSNKTTSPINNDMALLSLLKKRIGSSKSAVEDFYKANRKDLVDKEMEQVDILQEYASDVKVVDVNEVRSSVKNVIDGIRSESKKPSIGDVLKKTIGPGGVLEGAMVDKSELARIVKEELNAEKA